VASEELLSKLYLCEEAFIYSDLESLLANYELPPRKAEKFYLSLEVVKTKLLDLAAGKSRKK